MLDEILNKKDKLAKLSNLIRDLENQSRNNSYDVSKSEIVISQAQNGIGCSSTFIIVFGLVWMYIVYEVFSGDFDWFTKIIILLPAPVILIILGWIINWQTKINVQRKKIRKYLQDNKNIEIRLHNIKSVDIPSINQEIEKLEENYHNKLIEHFISNYDSDNNGEIDILENKDDYLNYLKSYQDKIVEISERMGEDYIHVLVKINDKLNLKREGINKSLVQIMKIKNKFDESSNIEVYDTFIKNELQYYNSLLANALYMSSSLVNNDRITFRTIYERFDKLNVFNTHYENQTLILLNSINNNLKDIFKEINNLNFSITSVIEDLTYATQEQTDIITQELESLGSSINFNTLVTGINTYQNYRINKKLNS